MIFRKLGHVFVSLTISSLILFKIGETIMSHQSSYKNHLAKEKSPYLLQHADNPVDWYPWGEEAFEKARREDKPIFLSIGYATCHWCHVMEHESFEDPEVAKLLNETFVCIKVDREERPDIDAVYMTVCQMMTGSGGWPLTIMMTPDKRPFFAATYIPKTSRFGRMGLMELIPRVQELWRMHRQELLQGANQIVHLLGQMQASTRQAVVDDSLFSLAMEAFSTQYDAHYGGFGGAPKFPAPQNFLFLLRYYDRTGDQTALEMVTHTLTQMRLGGIYDHLGFGFHRYSTDEHWLLPHFEKMLYDQAMLLWAFTETWQITHTPLFQQTAEAIATYVLRDMTHPEGGFYSAEDADSEGEEGKFYLWTEEELRQVLSDEEAELAIRVFNIKPEGNFRDEASKRLTGKNILHLSASPDVLAEQMHISLQEFNHRLQHIRQKLFAVREKRVHPLKDDKILTDWNGLMIAALAYSGRVFNRPDYWKAARQAAQFIEQHLLKDNRLLHRYRDGEAAIPGFLDDYAFFILGLTELYQATFDPHWLTLAIQLTESVTQHFVDSTGGFFQTPDDGEQLLIRKKEYYDGAMPSGYSVMIYNLLRLARFTGRTEWEKTAQKGLEAIGDQIRNSPRGFAFSLVALDFALGSTREIVLAFPDEHFHDHPFFTTLEQGYFPRQVVLVKTPETAAKLSALAPFTRELNAVNQHPTAFVCHDFVCELPVTTQEAFAELLKKNRKEYS